MVTLPEPPPPNPVPAEWEGILEPGEVVLWSIKKPQSVMLVTELWIVAFCLAGAIFLAWNAPRVWGIDA